LDARHGCASVNPQHKSAAFFGGCVPAPGPVNAAFAQKVTALLLTRKNRAQPILIVLRPLLTGQARGGGGKD
jgi:hypothetical protein